MNSFLLTKKSIGLSSLVIILALVMAACAPAATATQTPPTSAPVPPTAPTIAPTTAPAPTAAPTTAAATEATINVATDPKYGKILVAGNGMTLYMYTKDTPDKSTCAGGCLKAWPPLATLGSPKLGDGVDASMVGSTADVNGSKMVTYNHMPLYFWAKDTKPGDITGLGVGGVWFLVSPDGKVVGKEDTGGSTTPTASASTGAVLNVADSDEYGKILVDGKGMTLYIFTKDAPDTSNCKAGCLKAWPPFVANGNTTAGAGVDTSMIGTAALEDGTKIITYNHMPLYYWASDTKPGDTTGQNVQKVWFVVGPDGKAIMKP